MARLPAFPAGALLEIRAAGLFGAAGFPLALRTLDAAGPPGAPCRALVLPPGAPEQGLPEGHIVLLRIRRGHLQEARQARQAALFRKLARRAAGIELGTESALADAWATFFDPGRGWIGIVEEWIDGRYWKMETDDRLWDRPVPSDHPERDDPAAFRTEYDAKRLFMARLERLFQRLGAADLARQYRWSTWISQRNALKRIDAAASPHAGWTAVDFPGTALYLPALRQYVESRADHFVDLLPLLRDMEAGRLPAPGTVRVGLPEDRPAPVPERRAGLVHAALRKLAFSWHMLFRPEMRNARLMEEVQEGLAQGMLTPAEAERIRGQVHDPMLQTYLTCLAVHLAMLPLTNLTVLAGAAWYSLTRDLSWAEGARLAAYGLAFFAVFPMSPGSLARGLFVVAVALKRRSARRLRIALALSFWRYVGYMAFPLQMVSAFPALARYLAARWATRAVRAIPVYGQPGALLEHRMFDLAFNWPLTLARGWRSRRPVS
ncbi:MAG TPA: hypothetical protein P5567_01725 [Kiritimatiellia bacterium]|nr:hypothetical protein [Kiritimatiellia bacterium]HRZ11154.1 hypothetical protein [Kiritimatiellia bacterium]HSA19474.1 hypothetical protein [Kiritimatiellia bacterium]